MAYDKNFFEKSLQDNFWSKKKPKVAKDEAKRLKKELDESADNLAESKEHSQKLDKRFREVVGKLSGNFSYFSPVEYSDNLEFFVLIASLFLVASSGTPRRTRSPCKRPWPT